MDLHLVATDEEPQIGNANGLDRFRGEQRTVEQRRDPGQQVIGAVDLQLRDVPSPRDAAAQREGQARRVIERRRTQGRAVGGKMSSRKPNADVTTSSLVRNYQREVERQKQLVRKAETAQRNLLFIVGALRQLLADENFTNLLRAEGMDSLPQYLADRVWARGCGS